MPRGPRNSIRLRALPAAIEDETAIADDYFIIRPELGQRFLGELRAQVGKILDMPLSYPVIYGEFRATRIRKFPYRVVYLVKATEIVICAITHASRNPNALEARLDDVDE